MGGQPRSQEELRSIRRRGLRLVLPFLPFIAIVVILIGRTWGYIVFAVWATLWLLSLASISARIRRKR